MQAHRRDIDVLADFDEGQKMSASWRAKTPLFNQAEGQDGDDNNDIVVHLHLVISNHGTRKRY